jgi:hypothetical protein
MFLTRKQLAFIVLTTSSIARADFLPKNNLGAEDRILRSGPVTEQVFNEVIDEAEAVYGKIVSQHFNAQLKINRLWANSTVNASAQQSGNLWSVDMYGGMARRPEITRDGFALVLCHELGHHLGGYPFQKNVFFAAPRDWAAAEGEADYFATQACSRLLWQNQTQKNAEYRAIVPAYPKALCDGAWTAESDQNLCYRQMMANKSVADVNAFGEFKKPSWEIPSKSVVGATDNGHPATQCRLDTYIAGALCSKDFNMTVIPAKSLAANKRNSVEGEQEAAISSCMQSDGFTSGFRPRCWFKPLISGN